MRAGDSEGGRKREQGSQDARAREVGGQERDGGRGRERNEVE